MAERGSPKESYFHLGFPLSREAWNTLGIQKLERDVPAGTSAGQVLVLRKLTAAYNQRYANHSSLWETLSAGQLAAISALTEALRYLIGHYCSLEDPNLLQLGLARAEETLGLPTIRIIPTVFIKLFPPSAVMHGLGSEADYLLELDGSGDELIHEDMLTEMAVLSLLMENPALKKFRGLFDDRDLRRLTPYEQLVKHIQGSEPGLGPGSELPRSIFSRLREPMQAYPSSLEAQLAYIRTTWREALPPKLTDFVELASDLLKEETQDRQPTAGPPEILRFGGEASHAGYPEYESFSRDADWMSNVVLIAKNVYVWLYQLSATHNRRITRLDEIPDEELDRLARWGFTGLWLIGLWERSKASQTIKVLMGNPDAVASAYSLYDYSIAAGLGGEEAYENLRNRALSRGIRLASDMVPNHTGLDSRWVIEHPDWFMQLAYPPYPNYQFTGTDLSTTAAVSIKLEDGYWDRRDAAVVFEHRDLNGARYIYHGNDGTSMPWNDTAQLNFLLPEVREAVIQVILQVAKKFSIIRFDAAMTLAKRHYHRLWFPPKGSGGSIPSRSEHGMSKEEFDVAFPEEFWRMVVDRIASEAPDTLLLAEAFWLMEGYFVRTLGMHRVYNSAFMNMLKLEENAKFRETIKNVLEFSPEVLKRFVNFMSNPDELTAAEQFGKGDKYWGVATLLVTLPGLPMFGHGQVEGFFEKYGMEYQRSYWNEQPDAGFIAHHERIIFPLMTRRTLFSSSTNFAFYDFAARDGRIQQNVIAYSNRFGAEKALIIYNNAYTSNEGIIQVATPINEGAGEEKRLVSRTLIEALALAPQPHAVYALKDQRSNRTYLVSGLDLQANGLRLRLNPYQCLVFLDFQLIVDQDGLWTQLARSLGGTGVADLATAYSKLAHEHIAGAFRRVIKIQRLVEALLGPDNRAAEVTSAHQETVAELATFLDQIALQLDLKLTSNDLAHQYWSEVLTLTEVLRALELSPDLDPGNGDQAPTQLLEQPDFVAVAVALLIQRVIAVSLAVDSKPSNFVAQRYAEWLFSEAVEQEFALWFGDPVRAAAEELLVRILVCKPNPLAEPTHNLFVQRIKELFSDSEGAQWLQLHEANNRAWFNKEAFERLLEGLTLVQQGPQPSVFLELINDRVELLKQLATVSEYDAARFLQAVEKSETAA